MAKLIAREWLIFLMCLLIGFVVVVPTICALLDNTYADFWRALTMQYAEKNFWAALFSLFSTYLLVQFVRSIIWAVATSRR